LRFAHLRHGFTARLSQFAVTSCTAFKEVSISLQLPLSPLCVAGRRRQVAADLLLGFLKVPLTSFIASSTRPRE